MGFYVCKDGSVLSLAELNKLTGPRNTDYFPLGAAFVAREDPLSEKRGSLRVPFFRSSNEAHF